MFHPRTTVSPGCFRNGFHGFFFRRKYVLVEMGLGQWLLVGAEVIHYFLYYTLKGEPPNGPKNLGVSGFGMFWDAQMGVKMDEKA